jgi:AbrB family looped-hinge helix DNA binding protein
MSESEVIDIRTATITEKGQICIPNTTREIAGLNKGTKITIISYKDRVELRPLKKMQDLGVLECMLASEKALAKNWLSKEDDEAWKDL